MITGERLGKDIARTVLNRCKDSHMAQLTAIELYMLKILNYAQEHGFEAAKKLLAEVDNYAVEIIKEVEKNV